MKKCKTLLTIMLSGMLCFSSILTASAATNLFAGWPAQNKSSYQVSYSRAVQVMMLNYNGSTRGYIVGSNGANGHYGQGTANAVAAFQAAVGLAADGSCGPDTWNGLSNYAVTFQKQDSTFIYYTAKTGDTYYDNDYVLKRNYKTNSWQCYYEGTWYTIR